MYIKVLFDRYTNDKKLHTGWGLSFLVNDKILFDTGENGNWLLHNIENLDIDLNKIKIVVVSHEHYDHTGGLWELLKKKKGIQVYGCPGFSNEFKNKVKNFKARIIETIEMTEISKNIFITGQIQDKYQPVPEQALVVKSNNSISIITGCAHPGIINMVRKIKEFFPKEIISMILGGFHLMGEDKRIIALIVEDFRKIGVKKVGPTHCTGHEAEQAFRREYKEDFIHIRVGEAIHLFNFIKKQKLKGKRR